MKTYANWRGDLDDYLQVGDEVDEEMVDYFLNILPPACWTSNLVQTGEPHHHIGGRATYSTFRREGSHWYYAGHCYRGQETPPG
ncbi:hypothetical protein [Paenibacillus sp. HB172176]|uniref:hypothetical protein n=1 Tax=Paenibacillus sp. HB172176 TaxID=2493690 RepID=UPI00143CAEFC|nr:hypothetical protein [Paenibacillus sp. HB172176]